uniref:Integrase catalytic domain-containing protein n=1 Tax=Fagus sylvatica TaxID=28930 RepID=A0A2N9GQF3_FAGSY
MAGVVQPANFSDIHYDIPELKGDNYKIWKERVLLHLGWMDIDYAIRKDEPPALTDTSTAADIALYERWEQSNRLSMMFIKTRISAGIRGSVDQHEKVRDLLKAIDEQFVTSDKALASTLIMKFSSLRLTNVRGVREHIMQIRDIVAQLKKLEVAMSESFLVHYILNTLPHQYGPFKISYNTHKDKWSINELMTMCVQEEGRLVMEQGESAMLATHGKGKSQANQKGKGFAKPRSQWEGKQTNKSKKGANRSSDILEIIHTDICSPDMDSHGQKYFISFIDDYSRYMYLYMLYNKNEALDAFKIFKAEVEKQCGKQIKIVRSDRGGEYYGRYTEDGQAPGPFAKFLQEHGIVAQYTMPGSPDQKWCSRKKKPNIIGHGAELETEFEDICTFGDARLNTRIVESRNAKFLENDLISGSDQTRNIVSENDHSESQPSTSSDRLGIVYSTPQVQTGVEQPIIEVLQAADDILVDQEYDGTTLRRSIRPKRSAIPDDYVVYLQESDYNIGAENDPEFFSQAMSCKESELWYNAMKEEMNSMKSNGVWDLVELPNGVKAIGCKWVFKTKKDSLGNIERYKARLVAKGFTQKEGIDYTETFSLLSKKDSLRVILALVAHFDLELQQMDVKTAFLNGDLEEEVYMKQLEGFSSSDGEQLVCKLKKSIYGLKQASRQWYLKFHNVISSFGFVENIMDQCIYQKVSGSKICFLVLYVDDILLATNDKGLLHEVKQFLSKNFDMKDMGEASYVIGIKIHRDRFQGILGLSQETYINKVLKRFRMNDCSPSVAPIVKGDRFNLNQCPKNDLEREQMKNIPYASAVGSLMYAQVYTRPDIAFAVGMLGRYQSDPGLDHWRAAKKVMRYLQGTKDYMLMYRRTDNLEVIGYSDSDFAGCIDSRKSTSGYIFLMASGAVSWRSAKQTLTATSTMEAEFVSCFEATSHGVWLKSFISRLRIMDSISRPLRIYCDNSAAVFMAKNNKSGSRSKHIDIKYLAIRERIKEKKVVIEHVSTELMIADPLTKGMPPLKFKDHVAKMGLGSIM